MAVVLKEAPVTVASPRVHSYSPLEGDIAACKRRLESKVREKISQLASGRYDLSAIGPLTTECAKMINDLREAFDPLHGWAKELAELEEKIEQSRTKL